MAGKKKQKKPKAKRNRGGEVSLNQTNAGRVDYFLSFTHADRKDADWIAWCIENAGFTLKYQRWDFRPGQNFVLMMHESLLVADTTLIVLSPSFLEAAYAQPEWAAAFSEDPTGEKRKLIPIRIRKCKPGGLLRTLIHIDLVQYLISRDEDGAREELLLGLQKGRAKPLVKPEFPEYRR